MVISCVCYLSVHNRTQLYAQMIIPTALHHLGFAAQVRSMLSRTDSEAHGYFLLRGHRTYEQMAAGCGLDIQPKLDDLPLEAEGTFLLHIVPGGRPHCVAMNIATEGIVCLRDGMREWTMKTSELLDLIRSAVDKNILLSSACKR